ncbi:NACHT and WD repeat domain-containing protein 2-like [Liolophura sinensis]|uniref:NACHT and WD repeat domain-containing protein 2-like n=1 Tax=Liolophura sinensis TaxID=3198878 RepID=UPI003157F7CA
MSVMNDQEKKVLLGQVTLGTIAPVPSGVVRVFICTSGQDTVQERNALIEIVYPRVREYCRREYGLEFQAVDLHWGNEDNLYPDNHSTCSFYHREISRCQEQSEGPNFLLLMGQKRGRCSLPASIPDEEFRHLRHALMRHKGRQNRNYGLLEEWYELNENALPNAYILKPVSSNIPEYVDVSSICFYILHPCFTFSSPVFKGKGYEWRKWQGTNESSVPDMLRHGLMAKVLRDGFAIGWRFHCRPLRPQTPISFFHKRQYVESQVYHGIETAEHPDGKCLALFRNIIDLKNHTDDEGSEKFTELTYNERQEHLEIDPVVEKKLTALKSRLEDLLPDANRATFEVLWRYDDVIDPKLHKKYLDSLCDAVLNKLITLVDNVSKERNAQTGSELYQEVYQHWLRCKDLAESYRGREDILTKINRYLLGSSPKPLVLHGVSGSGKTFLMSKCSLEAQNVFTCPVITITRYVGYTPHSSSLRPLLVSLCSQLKVVLDDDPNVIPTDCAELVKLFHKLLHRVPKDYRLLMFLDDISLIRPDSSATDLTWLPSELSKNVRLVVSTKPGNSLARLRDNVVQEQENFLEIGALSTAEAYNLLLHLTAQDNRVVTENQRDTLRQAFQTCSLPLYVKIMTDFVCKEWVSSMLVSTQMLPMALADSVSYMFSHLEKTYGPVTVTRSMGYLCASKTGLSDCEMHDILSLDDAVLGEVFANRHPLLHRVPCSKWIQIKDTVSPFLASKKQDGVTVNFLCHEIFDEFVKERYLCDENTVKEIHSLLADYFLGSWANQRKPFSTKYTCTRGAWSPSIETDRLVPAQPHTFTSRSGVTRYNRRKFDQVARHLYCSGRLEELNRLVLFNYDWIYNKTKALSLEQIITDLDLHPSKETTLVSECLRVSLSVIEKDINNLAAELSGHLLPHYRSYPNIRQLINTCDRKGLKHNALIPIFPYHKVTGSSLKYVLEAHTQIDQCFLSHDGATLFTKGRESPEVFSCASDSGGGRTVLLTSSGYLHITPNGKYMVVIDHVTEKTAKIHSGDDGRFIGQLVVMNHIDVKPREKYHMGPVCVSNQRICIVVSADKSYLCIAELPGCTFLQIVELDNRATVCEITSDSNFVFCNSGRHMLTYNLYTLEHTSTAALSYAPNSMALTHDGRRCYVSSEMENKLTTMHVIRGSVDVVYKAVLEDWMEGDKIYELKVSPDDTMVVLRGSHNLVVHSRQDEQVTAHFHRPSESLDEFRLPMSSYERLVFTQTAFSGDSRYLFGTLFRNIYMWEISSGNLITAVQTPPGVVSVLLASPNYGLLYTLLHGHSSVQCWDVQEVTNKVDPVDQLCDRVTDIRVTSDQSRAFATCSTGEEIAVVEMATGTILDLLTHDSKVEDFAISPDGNHVLVSTKPKWSNCAVKVWNVRNRQIIAEFGNTSGYCVSYHKENALLLLYQQENTFKAPFHITRFTFYDENFLSGVFDFQVPFLLSKPFVTANDRHLVMFTARDYIGSKGMYDTPEVTVVDLETEKVINIFTPENFYDVTSMVAILDVRGSPRYPTMLAVIYLSEGLKDTPENGQLFCPQYGLLILDVIQGSIKAMCEPFISAALPINNDLLLANDFSFAIDGSSNIFDCVSMSYSGSMPFKLRSPRSLALNGKVVVFADGSILRVFRLENMEALVTCETHAEITTLKICDDDRTLVLGCNDGTLLSYILLYPDTDDCEDILSALPSRQEDSVPDREVPSRRSPRAWDKVSREDNIPGYSRPPSAKSTGPSEKELLEKVKPVKRIRPNSDTYLYMNDKSVTCAVM